MVILGLAVIITVALVYGSSRWQDATNEMRAKLEAARLPIDVKTFDPNELIGLPAPVQRYFRTVLKTGQPIVAAVSVEHAGTFNMSETGEQWKPFTSIQRVITKRPGFDWEARIEMLPGVAARVHDAYISGEGLLHASLFGLMSIVNLRGTPEIAQGELMRFFAEAAWYPTALLPSQGVHWEVVDNTSAKATLTDGPTTLTLLFSFDENDLIGMVRAEARWGLVSGVATQMPWEARLSNYQLRDGMRVPIGGEVAWMLPEGPKPYWRGRIITLSYEFAQ